MLQARSGSGRWRAAAGWPALLVVALTTHALAHGTTPAQLLYLGVDAAAVSWAWWGASHGRDRAGAGLIALGVSLSALGDLIWQVFAWTSGVPDVSVADLAYLGGYVALAAGLWRMADAGRVPLAEAAEGWIDALVVFVAVLCLVWQWSVAATMSDGSLPWLTRATWALYPALDAVLIGLVFRLVTAQSRTLRTRLAVVGGAGCWLASDLTYLLAADAEATSALLDTGWLLGALMMAWSCQPSAGHAARDRDRDRGGRVAFGLSRLAVCLGALLVPPGIELSLDVAGEEDASSVTFAGTFLLVVLVFVRAALLLRGEAVARGQVLAQQRYSAALAAHSADAVVVVSRDGRLLSDPSAVPTLAGVGVGTEVAAGDLVQMTGVDPTEAHAAFRRALQARGAVVDVELRCTVAGEEGWIGARLVDLGDDPDVRGVVVHVIDITDRKRAEMALAHQAFHDVLTGLANRALFADRVDQALRRGARGSGTAAVVFIDLDGFKAVNDTLGHAAGDALLREVAARLTSAVRADDTVARLGGDEFAVLVEQSGEGSEEAEATAARVLEVLARPIALDRQAVTVSGSVGIAVGRPGATADSLVGDADIAMYAAKMAGRGRAVVFDPGMRAAAVAARELEQELQGALTAGEFRLVYQPVVALDDGRVTGFEALLRWQSAALGDVEPERFVPVAEASGLIEEIGAWVLSEACATAAAWRAEHAADLTMAVNVSAVQLAGPHLVGQVTAALAEHGLPASALVLEVTETALCSDPERATRCLTALRALGVRVALDDFGTGYSSLAHLRQFTVDVLKIDRSFVAAIEGDSELPSILRGVIDLGRTLGLEILAEGIETEGQLALLRRGRCDLGQGYLFARPLESADAELMLLGEGARTGA
ncbi:putative bifunctional diguanylate cyclase/phosphodiesterase [Blastococcus sp. SYSU D00820]